MIEQTKFTYYTLGKALEKQKKQVNLNKRQMDLIDNDGKKLCQKEILENIFKERFDEIIELTDEVIIDDLTYYFKSNCIRIRFHNFENVTKCFEKN